MKTALIALFERLLEGIINFAKRHPWLTLCLLLLPVVLPILAQLKVFFGLMEGFSKFTRWLRGLPEKVSKAISDAIGLSEANRDRLASILGHVWKAVLFVILPLPLSLLLLWVGPANEDAVSEEKFRGGKPSAEFEATASTT